MKKSSLSNFGGIGFQLFLYGYCSPLCRTDCTEQLVADLYNNESIETSNIPDMTPVTNVGQTLIYVTVQCHQSNSRSGHRRGSEW